MNWKRTLCCLVLTVLCCTPSLAQEKLPMVKALLNAVEANDHAAFIEPGNATFKSAMQPQLLESVSLQLAGRMKAGYKLEALGTLKQMAHTVLLYKMSFDDQGDDVLVKLTLDPEGKAAGFWLQ